MPILRQRIATIFAFATIWLTVQGRQPPADYVRICCKTVAKELANIAILSNGEITGCKVVDAESSK
jgi:hypothetical protein